LGYCLHTNEGIVRNTGVIQQHTDAEVAYQTRAKAMADTVERLINILIEWDELVDVIIETPENWFGPKGMDSKNSDAVQRLYWQVGVIVGILSHTANVSGIWCVGPTQWKGQTPKPVMLARALKYTAEQQIFLPETIPHDTAEAVLLGRFGLKLRFFTDDGSADYQEPLICIHRRGYIPPATFTQQEFIDAEGE
jgi:hypothetical protein